MRQEVESCNQGSSNKGSWGKFKENRVNRIRSEKLSEKEKLPVKTCYKEVGTQNGLRSPKGRLPSREFRERTVIVIPEVNSARMHDVPHLIRLSINGNIGVCLIDTGAAVSLVKRGLISREEVNEYGVDCELTSVSGHNVRTWGTANIAVSPIGEKLKIDWTVILVDDQTLGNVDIILGRDFLKENQAHIKYEQEPSVTMWGREFKFMNKDLNECIYTGDRYTKKNKEKIQVNLFRVNQVSSEKQGEREKLQVKTEVGTQTENHEEKRNLVMRDIGIQVENIAEFETKGFSKREGINQSNSDIEEIRVNEAIGMTEKDERKIRGKGKISKQNITSTKSWELTEPIKKVKSYRVEKFDKNTVVPQFDVGELVYLKKMSEKQGISRKLMEPWVGPCRIVELLGPMTYRIRKCGGREEQIVHVDRLKSYTARNREFGIDIEEFDGLEKLDTDGSETESDDEQIEIRKFSPMRMNMRFNRAQFENEEVEEDEIPLRRSTRVRRPPDRWGWD